MKHFRYALYLVVSLHLSGARAGAYEDFFAAVQRDDVTTVSNLLSRGFDPNSRDPRAFPALTVALQSQAPRVAQLLIQQPSLQPDVLNPAGESALMMAGLKGDLESARKLIERGASVNLPGWSPLHYAATGPDVRIVELLLAKGAQVDGASPNGTTPLMMAARYGTEASVDLLLARGADVQRRNERNLGPADFARLGGREYLVRKFQ